MVSCQDCQTLNTLDSSFCKKCGVKLDDSLVKQSLSAHETLVGEGYAALKDGRIEEAALIAESALGSFPTSSTALALRGSAHERSGDLSSALECFERVVELNPDSALDKIKVTQLRHALAAQVMEVAPASRKTALVSSVAAAVFLLSVGAVATIYLNRSKAEEPKKLAMNVRPDGLGSNSYPAGPVMPGPAKSDSSAQSKADGGGDPNAAAGGPGDVPAVRSGNSGAMRDPRFNYENVPAGRGGTQLPDVSNDGARPDRPWQPNGLAIRSLEQGGDPPPSGAGAGAASTAYDDPPPKPIRGTSGNPTLPDQDPGLVDTAAKAAQSDPGQISIKVASQGAGNNGGGGAGAAAPSANQAEALIRAGRQQQLSGSLGAAATSYERALRAGADPGSTNQHLGDVYARLGRNGEAYAAYQRAIAAFESSLKAGTGDADRLKRSIETVKQAAKIVQ